MSEGASSLRTLATGLASCRIAFGLGFLAVPGRAAGGWIGPAANDAGGQVMIRATGARDLVLGVGGLRALREGRDERAWFTAQLVSDATDFVATWLARRELGPARSAFALVMAGGSSAIASAYLASLSEREA
jgi:hypothetical protein